MRQTVVIVILALILLDFGGQIFAQVNDTRSYKKNEIQIGRTGYYFERTHPLKFPTTILSAGTGFPEFYVPYLSYRRRVAKLISLKVSYEDYSVAYFETNSMPPLYEILVRNILQAQFVSAFHLSLHSNLEFIPFLGTSYKIQPSS